jgi:hypothetical protein
MRFHQGQVVKLPKSNSGATSGTVRNYVGPNANGTDWELLIWVDGDGEAKLSCFEERQLKEVGSTQQMRVDETASPDEINIQFMLETTDLENGRDLARSISRELRQALRPKRLFRAEIGRHVHEPHNIEARYTVRPAGESLITLAAIAARVNEWDVRDDGWRIDLTWLNRNRETPFVAREVAIVNVVFEPWSGYSRRVSRLHEGAVTTLSPKILELVAP